MHLTATNQREDLRHWLVRVIMDSSTVSDTFITGIRNCDSLSSRAPLILVALDIISTTPLRIPFEIITQSHTVDEDHMSTLL